MRQGDEQNYDPADPALLPKLADVVREAGDLAHRAFGNPLKSWLKDNSSPVTEVDMAVDAMLRPRLAAIAPDAGWLSEESATQPSRRPDDRFWIVDPIDGTKAFMAGRPDWAVSVALVEAGRPVLAALFAPVTDEMFLAAAGAGATRNAMPIGASRGDSLAGARMGGPRDVLDRLAALVPGAPGFTSIPRIHSLALRLARVADGTLDVAFASQNSHAWDLAAADLLVHEAGGALTTAAAETLGYHGTDPVHGVLIAAGRARHQSIIEMLRKSGESISF